MTKFLSENMIVMIRNTTSSLSPEVTKTLENLVDSAVGMGASETRERLKRRIDARLNDCLCEMKPDHDDSITGFNEAWDLVRAVFEEERQRIAELT